eukprot:CAMPEP_0115744786 /NCGR_PEP_ID=MMETSP0272-20121206/91787_1 /TAXON_ID=71861 /ORGANISM="Scrippsiella trochoidea, Strain CCMP3099" /LENGTH=75 /DNA_ID=CAMNT_0003189679 /DNA_START=401 /DNA_END=628 /DNA_ORIENTATION=-
MPSTQPAKAQGLQLWEECMMDPIDVGKPSSSTGTWPSNASGSRPQGSVWFSFSPIVRDDDCCCVWLESCVDDVPP